MQATVWNRPVTACRSLAAKRGRTAASEAPPATASSYRRAASSACRPRWLCSAQLHKHILPETSNKGCRTATTWLTEEANAMHQLTAGRHSRVVWWHV